ncbi:hypothetical protein AAFF_G00222080 [Aldrovandia affinis]|uniref:Arrestin-like N-terminal domain-containing protein n=1 Tax=Aldrovandia affinis TaxID=143900 RepID=A0AAD7RFI2_9TELE|nr:hypothetical protein AAFF_G00222080 [Aldrovandia affinis]
MAFKSIRSFKLELEGPDDAVFSGGEVLSGRVVLELNREAKVRALKVQGRGVATAHWLENRSVGMNTAYNDYTSKETYFRKRQHLIREIRITPDADNKREGPTLIPITGQLPLREVEEGGDFGQLSTVTDTDY